jgi:hypothetical protein
MRWVVLYLVPPWCRQVGQGRQGGLPSVRDTAWDTEPAFGVVPTKHLRKPRYGGVFCLLLDP